MGKYSDGARSIHYSRCDIRSIGCMLLDRSIDRIYKRRKPIAYCDHERQSADPLSYIAELLSGM